SPLPKAAPPSSSPSSPPQQDSASSLSYAMVSEGAIAIASASESPVPSEIPSEDSCSSGIQSMHPQRIEKEGNRQSESFFPPSPKSFVRGVLKTRSGGRKGRRWSWETCG
ncbi:unnamed protein product, partial [Musa acuminata var. zebrina]